MWSDNDIDNAFQRLNPPEPDPTPFPLDAWLRLETELDKAVIERTVRRRLWKFFAAEVAVVMLAALGWLLWPTGTTHFAEKSSKLTTAAANAAPTDDKSNQPASANQPVSAGAGTVPAAAAADGTLRNADEVAANKPVPHAADNEAAFENPRLKSAPNSAAALAAVPAVKHATSAAITRFSIAAGMPSDRRRRSLDNARPAYPAIATPQNARLISGRSSAAARLEHTTTQVAARQTSHNAAGIAKNAYQHLAAGSLAAPTEAPAEAVVADAASPGQLRRESQLPLLNQLPAATAPAAEGKAIDAPDAVANVWGTAIATLAPNVARLPLAAVAAVPTPLTPIAAAPASLPVVVRQPRFYIGLVAAPDLTTVKFVDVERPKLNIGVVLEYRLTNRLLVSTGLLRANKEYYARRDDYDWTNYPKAQTRDFYWVDGACTVLDVPLNLRYDAIVRPQARLFGSVGLSSFFMQREHYSYDYTEFNTPYVWERSYVNENQHLFSVLNLSFGYEHSLGGHWRVQAEPYAKLPLGGVGAGKVRLTSGGVFFGVKYGF